MNQQQKDKALASLTEAIDKWLETQAGSLSIYLGQQTAYFMALAALSVLQSVEDCHESLEREGEIVVE